MPIKILNDEIAYEGDFLRLIKRHFLMRNRRRAIWEVAERKRNAHIVAIAALTETKEIVLEKIFRIPLETYVIELPAGVADKNGETHEEAIRRELLEETGYVAEEVVPLLYGPLIPGLTPDRMTIFFGGNARQIRPPRPEPTEDIEVITIPLETLVDFVFENQEQMDVDLKVLSVLAALKKKGLV